jgi:hypothetical protein
MDYNIIYQQTLLTKINSIKQDIGFTALDLFKVNSSTISLYNLMFNFHSFIFFHIVLLIRTSYER